MILRTSIGRSFKGVGQYVLHDKGAQTDERVSFIEADNLAFDDGSNAIREMIHTAKRQKTLKRQAGGRATETSKPVYHLSLSWDTRESPSLKEQMDAARSALRALGLHDRQAMIVGHTDTDNPHVHVVVNLVCPVTGKTASLSNDQLKLSKWAEQYRRERGEEQYCPQRKKNNERRKDGEYVKARNKSRQEYDAWKRAQTKEIWDEFRTDRAKAREDRRGQYDALYQQRVNRMAARKDEIKAFLKPLWRDLYKEQRKERQKFDTWMVSRLKYALKQQKIGKPKAVFLSIFAANTELRINMEREQAIARQHMSNVHKQRIKDAYREVNKAWQYDRDQLKAAHKAEDQRTYEATKAKTSKVWEQREPGPTGQDFEQSADRRKDHETRQAFDQDLGANRSEEERKANREQIRKRKERKRNRPRRRGDTGRTMDM